MPVFAASTTMSENTASSCATTKSAGTSCTAVDAERVLGRERDDRGRAVHPCRGERLQVGLDARRRRRCRSPAIVNTHGTLKNVTPFAGTSRIRFDGCVLSPEQGHPGTAEATTVAATGRLEACPSTSCAGRACSPGEEVAHLGVEGAREARFAELPPGLDPRVREAIGVPRLYTHQREVWDAAGSGHHVLVTTGTASGKTLAFNLPVLAALAQRAETARALPLPDEGSRPGPVPHPGRLPAARSCDRRSTTATPRSNSEARSAAART